MNSKSRSLRQKQISFPAECINGLRRIRWIISSFWLMVQSRFLWDPKFHWIYRHCFSDRVIDRNDGQIFNRYMNKITRKVIESNIEEVGNSRNEPRILKQRGIEEMFEIAILWRYKVQWYKSIKGQSVKW